MSEKCKSLAKKYESYLSETFDTFTELKNLTDEEISGATPGTVCLALVNQSLLMLKTQELLLEILLSIDEIGDKINAMGDGIEKQEPTQETNEGGKGMIAFDYEDRIVFVEDVNYFKIEPICGTRKYTIRINFGKHDKASITIGRFSSKEKAIDDMHKLSERFINKDRVVMIKND